MIALIDALYSEITRLLYVLNAFRSTLVTVVILVSNACQTVFINKEKIPVCLLTPGHFCARFRRLIL